MARPSANQRLFVAVYPPVEVAKRLLGYLDRMDLPRHRVVAWQQVHLTLQFIGDTPVKELNNVIESMMRSASGVKRFELTIESLAPIPLKGPARLIAAHADGPAGLLEMQRRLATRLAKNKREKVGDRFLPHLTLCRFRTPLRNRPEALMIEPIRFTVEDVLLMRSILYRDGPEHIEVSRVALV